MMLSFSRAATAASTSASSSSSPSLLGSALLRAKAVSRIANNANGCHLLANRTLAIASSSSTAGRAGTSRIVNPASLMAARYGRWASSSSSSSTSSASASFSTTQQPPPKHALLTQDNKVLAPPMVYISGEEMTHYVSQLVVKEWIEPYFDVQQWRSFELSCAHRDATDDQVLHDAVAAGKEIGAIFKEPTITPTAQQQEEMGLSQSLGSPNGAMRRGWNGITISRDTIHIDGVELGYKNPVYFERHAVGGEYGAGWNEVGSGICLTTYLPDDESKPPFVVDKRTLKDDHNVVVVYHNPYDNVGELAHLFFQRCLAAKITPYIVTKKTVFKWQEGFWQTMKQIFDEFYYEQFLKAGLLEKCNGELNHLISDAATMKLIRWTEGGFGMAAHNYDGDMLTDQIAQVHRSPGFITSNLVGKNEDGSLIKEFEASHGTVSDLWHDHLAGKETSMNPLGLVEAMMGAMEHAAVLDVEHNPGNAEKKTVLDQVVNFNTTLRTAMHNTFRYGQGTRDMSGPSGFTTEDFIHKVRWRLDRYLAMQSDEAPPPQLGEPSREYRRNYNVDEAAVHDMFQKYDKNQDGFIDLNEFTRMLVKMNLAPTIEDDEATEKEPDV